MKHWNNLTNHEKTVRVYSFVCTLLGVLSREGFELLHIHFSSNSRSVYLFVYSPDGAQFTIRVSDHGSRRRRNKRCMNVSAKNPPEALRLAVERLTAWYDPCGPCPPTLV